RSVNFNCVALADGSKPRLMGLKEMLVRFLDFRCEVVSRRSAHALAAAQARLHIVGGFLSVLAGGSGRLDRIVAAIRGAADGAAAAAALVDHHGLSREQVGAVDSTSGGRSCGVWW
ncbi:putative DNA gyrase subunit A, chloroplastic/mitochondrial, partial [Tetrabaena socialis]